ncbi:MAG: hypothetical protein JOZ07_01570 [Solirubrobacterales bacterium]|nr:hypothetical protein [Solirubrobacterales bacterium]
MALLPPAAFLVHQLRYELAYGAGASAALRRTGHAYLHSVVPWLVVLIGLASGSFLCAVGRAFSRHTSPRSFGISFTALWALCAGALIAIFACQETLEGLFATGHPGGWAAVFGYGGWWAIPAAVCVGLVLAAIFHGARWVVREVARRRRAGAAPRAAALALVRRLRDPVRPVPAPLLSGWSNRGPPAPAR